MQLVAYGAQDIYLTGNPQITFFKVVYRRHTNFSMESIQQTIQGTGTVGASASSGTVTISRNGDLVTKVYVTTNTDILDGTKIVSDVSLEIGGQLIDRHYEEWNNIWNELTIPTSKVDGFVEMAHAAHSVFYEGLTQVPLNFWFCRNPGLALPLIALQYHEVKLKFNWGTSAVASVGGAAVCQVWVDYIYLDTDERRRFAQVSHEYLIEQVQKQSLAAKTTNKLNFNHPVKELIWTNDMDFEGTVHLDSPPLSYGTAKLVLNGHDRFAAQEEEYFQLRQPYEHHTKVPRQNAPHALHVFPNGTVYSAATLPLADVSQGIDSGGDLSLTALEWNAVMIDAKGRGLIQASVGAITVSASADTSIIAINGGTSGGVVPKNSLKVGAKYDIKVYDSGDLLVPVEHKQAKLVAIGKASGASAGVPVNGTGPIANGQSATDITLGGLHADTSATTIYLQFTVTATHTAMDGTYPHLITHTIADGDALVINGADPIAVPHKRAATSAMNRCINVYSFALKPEEHQPSGTCNFSRIDNAQLVTLRALEAEDNMYAVNYNVLRIMSGMGGLAYSN